MKELKDLWIKKHEVLQKMSQNELMKEARESEKKMYTMKMKLAVWELKQTHLMKHMRRYIAVLHTLLTSSKS